MTGRGSSGGDAEIRAKAPFPKKFSPGTFRDFDEWFADHVGLRYPLIYAGSELHVGLLRRPLDRHIFFGRDGWMFWTDDAELFRRRWRIRGAGCDFRNPSSAASMRTSARCATGSRNAGCR